MPVLTDVPLERVVVLRALQGWGDALVAVPGLRALRANRPEAHVTLVAAPRAVPYWEPFGEYVDEVVALPAWPGLPDLDGDVASAMRLVEDLRARRADLAIQLHGSGVQTNPLVGLFGAARTAGHHLPGQWRPDHETYLPFDPSTPEPRRALDLLVHLGVAGPDDDPALELPLSDADVASASGLVPDEPYVVVNVGASHAPRRWPLERFALVVDHVVGLGLPVVLTGSAGDRALTQRLAALVDHDVTDLAGATSLGELAAVVDRAALVVTNDTGVSHVAVARRRPSVTVFCFSDASRWGPLDRDRHTVVGPAMPYAPAELGSHRCLRDGCTQLLAPDARPARVPSADDVIDAVDRQLDRHPPKG